MSVASKNLFELLGNDDGDSDNTGPVKTVDKTSTRTAKRNTDGAAPAAKTPAAAPPARRGGFSGSEAAFRDRGAGADRNRVKSTDDNARGGARGGSGARMRGGRGARYPRDRDDRHSKGLPSGSEKQAEKSWGGHDGEAEMKDEQAGEDIAKKDEKEAATEDAGGDGDGEPAEPEDKSISYDTYLAQVAEKKMALGSESMSVRKANEGSKLNKQWAAAKPLVKDEDDEFISGTGGKAKRERERKTKQLVEIDNRFVEERGTRGGRGGPRPERGGRGGRGGGGGGGGGSGPRPSDAPRGGGPGRGRGGGGRGGPSGGSHIPVSDPNVFPELGS